MQTRALDVDRLAPSLQLAELGNQGRCIAARLNRNDQTRDTLVDLLYLPRKLGLLIGHVLAKPRK